MKKVLYYLVIILIIVYIILSNYKKLPFYQEKQVLDKDLLVYFIDVGEADSTLISSNNHYMLIDAGNNEDGEKLVNYFKSLGINKFDTVILTHAHEDHVGGMDNIINNFEIGNFYMPDVPFTSTSYEETLKALDNKNIKFKVPSGNTIDIGEAKLKFLYVGSNEEDINSTSIVSKLIYGNTSFLFTGDTTWDVEESLLEKDIECDVLKASHHGSNDGANYKFLKKLRSKIAVISCGKDNEYGHPHEKVLDKLKTLGNTIYRTDIDGTIIVKSNGESISVEKVKTDTNGEEK